ncbi:MAG: (2Fe-2S)-binding protein [SAR324 cluster bacterium]|nr:(2Fe-2S)-binding protein [SAR324 cluster bacterium]MBL7035444.1 (2Fe-2S)-binding protein [SAR324 cluster bacterium]
MTATRYKKNERGTPLNFTVNGETVEAFPGESIAAALLVSGRRTFRHTAKGKQARGFFCGMGMCFDCVATVDGVPNVRTCMTEVQPDCVVEIN